MAAGAAEVAAQVAAVTWTMSEGGMTVTDRAPETDGAEERGGSRWLGPHRLVVFELEPDEDGRPRYWMQDTAASDLERWAETNLARFQQLAPHPIVRVRLDLTEVRRPRATERGMKRLRAKLARQLERQGGVVEPFAPIVVYAIELIEKAPDGRTRLYVGTTSNLDNRLAEHRGEVPDGSPPGKAVRRYGFGESREDLVASFRAVSKASALELESQVCAALALDGYVVHGDRVKHAPTSASFVPGRTHAELMAGYERATGRMQGDEE